MCGIFGIIQATPVSKDKLRKVSNTISHRGPDDEGYLLFNNSAEEYQRALGQDSIKELHFPKIESISKNYNSAFLHRRLSIIDLSASGHQPMSYENENLWITLNGEIYNYIELKEELKNLGYSFRSSSDTEVVLAAYQEWGEDCVQRFNGMWAFAIWDQRKNSIFLSRDRFGIKPLFYYFKKNVFIFCSEIKGIREYLNNNLTLDDKQIYRFMVKGEIAVGETDETIYKEIKQLKTGHNLILKNDKLFIEKYWQLKLRRNQYSFNENVDKLQEFFYNSLKFRLRSDVQVGSCLSGGIDSSSIVSFGSKKFNKQFHTFSAIWPGEECDESYYIRKVNDKYKCFAHEFEPDLNDIIDTIDKEIWHQEMPLAGPSLIAQWFVMKKAKDHGVKVLLDGQGADEVLSGYPRYIEPYINEMLYYFKWGELISNYSSLEEAGYNWKRILKIQKNKLIKSNWTALPLSDFFKNKYNYKFKFIPSRYNFLPDYLKDEINKSCLPTLLHVEDRNSMAHSVESRVPYLDYKLVDFAVNIPTEQKIKGALTKIILRESMKDYLPIEVYNRTDKIGFETPIEQRYFLHDTKFNNEVWDYIRKSDLWKMDILNKNAISSSNYKWANFAIYSLAKFIDMWS